MATFALIAFAFQGFVTQTHIHFAQPLSAGARLMASADVKSPAKDTAKKGIPKNAPGSDESMKCPLCQAVGYAGHFVSPSQAVLLLPASAVSILPLAILLLSPRESPSYIWQGRGPPRF